MHDETTPTGLFRAVKPRPQAVPLRRFLNQPAPPSPSSVLAPSRLTFSARVFSPFIALTLIVAVAVWTVGHHIPRSVTQQDLDPQRVDPQDVDPKPPALQRTTKRSMGQKLRATPVLAPLMADVEDAKIPEEDELALAPETSAVDVQRPVVQERVDSVSTPAPTRVPFVATSTGAIVVSVQLEGPTTALELPMLVDTGATISLIGETTANRLGLKYTGEMLRALTPRGLIHVPVAIVEAITLGAALKREDLRVGVCESCVAQFGGGLLGLNFLQHFPMTIDHPQRALFFAHNEGRAEP